jgi:hypothetical protein
MAGSTVLLGADQDLTISLRRIPPLPRSSFLINPVGQETD